MTNRHRGDFSRITFDSRKHHSAVLMQQGRVQLDADWNEQVEIVAHRLRTQAIDFVGTTGAPATASGFAIQPRASLGFTGQAQYLQLGHEPSKLYAAIRSLRVVVACRPGESDARESVLWARYDRPKADQELRLTYRVSILDQDDGKRVALFVGDESSPALQSEDPIALDRWCRVELLQTDDGWHLATGGAAPQILARGPHPPTEAALFLVGQSQLEGDGPTGFVGSIREIRLSEATEAGEQLAGLWEFDRMTADLSLDRSPNSNPAVLGGAEASTRPTHELEDLTISPGRYYVDGLLCENEQTESLTQKAEALGTDLTLDRAAGQAYLFYLDAWERFVAPAQDRTLLEPALRGADTAGRRRVEAQVRWVPVSLDEIPPDSPSGLQEWDQLEDRKPSSGGLRVRRDSTSTDVLENRLYRVEVYSSGSRRRWRWSRDNASVMSSIVHLEGDMAVLAAGASGEIPFAQGDRVEIIDDRSIAMRASHRLLQVKSVDPTTRSVTFDESVPSGVGTEAELNPVAVLWNGEQDLVAGAWVELERGIEVCFDETDAFRTGDHWVFTSRTETNGIDWPVSDSGQPLAQAPSGPRHHLSALAVLAFESTGFVLRDCRVSFQPLSTGAVSKAGDSMYGPLEIKPKSPPVDRPSLKVEGIAEADVLMGELGTARAVRGFNLARGAVTQSKISPEVGTVPTDYAILGHDITPPDGYAYSQYAMVVPNPEPRWTPVAELSIGEETGELHSVAIGKSVYTISGSGRVWEYDVAARALTERRPIPEAHRRFGAAGANGKLYVVGGVDDQGRKVGSTLAYDPSADSWEWRQEMPTPRSDLALAATEGKLYAMGGLSELLFLEIVSARNEIYDAQSDSWDRARSLSSARYGMAAAAGNGGVFTFGGRRRWFLRWLGQAISAINEEYLPDVDRWVDRPNLLPAPRSDGAAVSIGDLIFLVGGRSLFGWTSDTTRYSPQADAWEPTVALSAPVVSPGVAAVDGRLIVHVAGSAADQLQVLECPMASTLYVHRKVETVPGDLEPQLRLGAGSTQTQTDVPADLEAASPAADAGGDAHPTEESRS